MLLTFGRRRQGADGRYVVLGVPYDSSQTYISGAREAPAAIRAASAEIEDYDLLEGVDLLEIDISDAGDVEVSFGSAEATASCTEEAVRAITSSGSVPVLLGGEHTVTAFAAPAVNAEVLVALDAHLDFRDSYLGNRFSHACALRRAAEALECETVVAGVRSACREELEDAERLGVRLLKFGEHSSAGLAEELVRLTRGRRVYLSIDMDFLDPKEARGVGNPEPPGYSYSEALRVLEFLRHAKLAALDVTEVVPAADRYTPVVAAKLVLKALVRAENL
ncbi:MAG: agmatinase [Euryarchaeota archaeon]|nr:agmatinase [Euryarchaeota archaeon]